MRLAFALLTLAVILGIFVWYARGPGGTIGD